jgi:hypothetical protein
MSERCAGLSKRAIIEKLEVPLTPALEQAGLRSHALYDTRGWKSAPKIAVNPSHFFWRQLIETYGVPFIKIELLRTNPLQMDLRSAPQVIGKYGRGGLVETLPDLAMPAGTTSPSIASRIHHAALRADYFLARAGLSGFQRLNRRSTLILRRAYALFSSLLARRRTSSSG